MTIHFNIGTFIVILSFIYFIKIFSFQFQIKTAGIKFSILLSYLNLNQNKILNCRKSIFFSIDIMSSLFFFKNLIMDYFNQIVWGPYFYSHHFNYGVFCTLWNFFKMGIDYFLNLAHIGLVHGIIIYYIGLVFCHKKIFASKLLFFGLTMKQFVFNIMMVGISLTALSIALIIILPLCIPIVSYLLVFIDGLIHWLTLYQVYDLPLEELKKLANSTYNYYHQDTVMDLTKEEIEKENLEFLKNNPESPLNKVMAINVFYGTIIPVFITTPFGVTLVGGMYIGTMIGSIVCDLIC